MIKVDRGSEPTMATWTITKLVEKMDDGEVDFDIDIQRKYVWKDKEQKSLLIQSAILNDFIPPFYFNITEDGKYDGIDAKQRATTFCDFLNDKFALEGLELIPVKDENGKSDVIDINGLVFSELPEEIQKVIGEANITICTKNRMDWEEEGRNFYNLNNGKSLTAATKNRVKAKSLDAMIRLSGHKIFTNKSRKTKPNPHADEELAIRSHAILNADDVCMDASWMNKYKRNTVITPEDEAEIFEIFDRMYNIYELIEDNMTAKRMYQKTHFVSLIPVMLQSLNDGLSDKQMEEWFVDMFQPKGAATKSEDYNMAAGRDGTGKNAKIKIRLEALRKSYDEFFSDMNLKECG